MIKWDLKTQSCCFYDIFESKKLAGVKVVYTGQGVTENEVKVKAMSRAFLGTVLEHGKTRAEQVDEDNLEVHRQLLKNVPRIWGAPVLEKVEIN